MSIHGRTKLFEERPNICIERNALYMPTYGANHAEGRAAGLFKSTGKLILEASRFRGPEPHSIGSPISTSFDASMAKNVFSEPLFYMGQFANHYGHFLVDTLCRLWAYKRSEKSIFKILYHGNEDAVDFLNKNHYMKTIFNSLGITDSTFIKFDEPTIISEVFVPEPAFEELSFVFKEFAQFFNMVGDLICPKKDNQVVSDKPIYLTKAFVKSGVSRFVNEEKFVELLLKSGIEVISPEKLNLSDQISLFRTRSVVTGLVGSAFHTSIFVHSRNYMAINYHDTVWSNQLLFDKANKNVGFHICPDEDSVNSGPDSYFGNNFHIENPEKLVNGFLRRLEDYQLWLSSDQYVTQYRDIPQLPFRRLSTGSAALSNVTEMLSLDSIGRLTGTDKSSRNHGYLGFYDRFLKDIRETASQILEIGVLNGQSLQMWGMYFSEAKLIGLDINPETLRFSKGRLTVILANQGSSEDLEAVVSKYQYFDVIIDDGSHIWEHQIKSFRHLFSIVESGGFYIIEDLQVCFPEIPGFEHYKQNSTCSTVDFIEKLSTYVIRGGVPQEEHDSLFAEIVPKIEFIATHYGTALIKKR
jgi:hypothetical protein